MAPEEKVYDSAVWVLARRQCSAKARISPLRSSPLPACSPHPRTGMRLAIASCCPFWQQRPALSILTYYYVLTVPSSTTFTLSATSGGSALTLTTNGTATLAKLHEPRLRLANKISSNSDSKDVSYEGDNTIIKVHNTQSVGFTFDTDAFTIGAHATIFGLSEVTSNLPDSYTSAYGLFGSSAELTGQTAGFWGEADDTQTSAAGLQSTKTKRYWYPLGAITASKPPELTTSDKPSSWQYTFNVTNMAPTVDVMGVALPVTGSPLIVMDK
jgi:hypothetical protein